MYDIALILHLLGLTMGGAAAYGLPTIGAVTAAAPPEHRPSVARAVPVLKKIGHAGMGLLILTGLYMATVSGLWGQAPVWFWLKLAAVAVLIGGIVAGGKYGGKAMQGDAEAAAMAKKVSLLNIGVLVLILILAVLSFA